MSDPLVRYQVRLEPLVGRRVERWAQTESKSQSAALALLVQRGLDHAQGTELAHLERIGETHAHQIEQLQAQLEALEARESERFRLLLGHLQQHQAMTTEVLQLLRLLFGEQWPTLHPRAIEAARRQVSDDAVLYRASLSAGAPVQPVEGGRRGEAAA